MRTLTQYLCKIIIGLAVLAGTAASANVTVKLQGNYTVTSGTTRITVPLTLLQAGHVYTMTAAPVSGNVTAYGDPYLWGLVYKEGSTTARVVSQSRHSPDLGERVYLRKEMLNSGENKAEFWARCETSSCYMRLTIYERAKGTFDKRTFYREGVEPGVIDGQFSLYKDFYHPTEKNGTYGLQVDYQTNRYIYLYRDDNFSTSGMNALSFWVRSSGSIDDGDLYVALTTSNHGMITSWIPLSYYVDMPQSHTWYRVLIPFSDLNPSGQSVRGLAVLSTHSGFVYFDDMEFVSTSLPEPFKLRLPVSGYTPYSVPISAVMDNSLNTPGVITAYNGQQGLFSNGCKEYLVSGSYINCSGSVNNYEPPDDVLGYRRAGGGLFTLGINYNDGVSASGKEYLFYDEHTGYDFVPAGASNLNVPVYAATSGTVSYGQAPWNEVIITHGDGCSTHYLHMMYDSYLISSGVTVTKGARIGTVGNTGGVSPHLHFTVKCNGNRVDPYAANLWE